MNKTRKKIEVEGIVQGVGFRPFIYRLAKKHNLGGFVLNDTRGVKIEVEGEEDEITRFIRDIKNNSPPLSNIKEIKSSTIPPRNPKEFIIRKSKKERKKKTLVSPDIAVCDECKSELLDPEDRRYRYPFINCTNCGPRFTIIKELPYDREKTTMKEFKMCEPCADEYCTPENRRFHAQPNACPVCGPEVELIDNQGKTISGDSIKKTGEILKEGHIVAVKGLGGFHLACDATNKESIKLLRKRKNRPFKPLALMAPDLETIEKYTDLTSSDRDLLESPRAPIVLIKKKENCSLPENIAPGNNYIGFMLPYTPLHVLLFDDEIEVLVMTSGNRRGEPIIYGNDDALKVLSEFADYLLIHNRKIYIHSDDSVVTSRNNRIMIIRRSRGYSPEPIRSPAEIKQPILACGGHLKNTFSLGRKNEIITSHHTGDLDNPRSLSQYERGIKHYLKLFDISPEVIAVDLHPDYLSTKFGMDFARKHDLELVKTQQHHAHVTSCMAEYGITEKVIGISWDGSGFGDDSAIWGCEFLICDPAEYSRKAHLKYIPMPGGEKAVREPWRMAASYLYKYMDEEFTNLKIDFTERLDNKKWRVLKKMIDNEINCPLTSSAGRLFDAVSSLLGIRDSITYLGQAAVELETMLDKKESGAYNFKISGENKTYIINPEQVIKSIIRDIEKKTPAGKISTRFHNSLVNIIAETAKLLREDTGINRVILSGGVFQNRYLLNKSEEKLIEMGFDTYSNSEIPINDGGLSTGQVLIATAKKQRED